MPVSVDAVLRESLADPVQHHHHQPHHLLQSQIASATKHLVLKTIEYEEYPENFLAQNDAIKAKYILLSAAAAADKNGPAALAKKTLASSPAAAQNGSHGPGKLPARSRFPSLRKVRLCCARNFPSSLPFP